MRHRKKINHLGRKSQHRQAMLSNMASSLIIHKRIFTTVAKAKALRVYVEPLITKSKEDSTHSRRTVFSYLQNKHAVSELFREVSQKIASRPGGYTRILKTGFRPGDAAEMCFIELVDYNTNMLKTTEDSAKKTRRSRRGKKSSEAAPKAASPKAEEKPADEVAEKAEETQEVDATTDASAEEVDAAAEVKAEDTNDVKEQPEVEVEEKEEPETEKKEQPEADKKEEPKAEKKEEPKGEPKDDSKTEGDDSADDTSDKKEDK